MQNTWSHVAIVAAPCVASASSLQAAENLGISLAQKLLTDGAAQILQAAKQQTDSEKLRQTAAKQSAATSSANTGSGASS